MKYKKAAFLFLAFLLPISVFLFLKFFGKNEFAVPVFFSDEIAHHPGCDSFTYSTPYSIHDSVLTTLSWSKDDTISLFIFVNSIKRSQEEIVIQATRIITEFPMAKFKIYFLGDDFTEKRSTLNQERSMYWEFPIDAETKDCIFLLSASDNTALIDTKRRIRGQYDITNREEADRLILEMKIILKKY